MGAKKGWGFIPPVLSLETCVTVTGSGSVNTFKKTNRVNKMYLGKESLGTQNNDSIRKHAMKEVNNTFLNALTHVETATTGFSYYTG